MHGCIVYPERAANDHNGKTPKTVHRDRCPSDTRVTAGAREISPKHIGTLRMWLGMK